MWSVVLLSHIGGCGQFHRAAHLIARSTGRRNGEPESRSPVAVATIMLVVPITPYWERHCGAKELSPVMHACCLCSYVSWTSLQCTRMFSPEEACLIVVGVRIGEIGKVYPQAVRLDKHVTALLADTERLEMA